MATKIGLFMCSFGFGMIFSVLFFLHIFADVIVLYLMSITLIACSVILFGYTQHKKMKERKGGCYEKRINFQ